MQVPSAVTQDEQISGEYDRLRAVSSRAAHEAHMASIRHFPASLVEKRRKAAHEAYLEAEAFGEAHFSGGLPVECESQFCVTCGHDEEDES